MGLTYERINRVKRNNERELVGHGIFPNCVGLFPDCPLEPSLVLSMCRTCPKTDGLKKPKLNEEKVGLV
jgi:hypothetical protein